jgi:hypothetical protein
MEAQLLNARALLLRLEALYAYVMHVCGCLNSSLQAYMLSSERLLLIA